MNPRDLRRLLDQVATVRRGGGLDRSGNPTSKSSISIRCRVERRQRRVSTYTTGTATPQFGEEVLSDTTLVTDTPVLPTDQVVLPGESRERAVLTVESAGTPNRGVTLYQVAL